MHVDPVFARRTLFGGQVVHGIHAVLWALEGLGRGGTLARLDVRFLVGIDLIQPVECRIESDSLANFSLTIWKQGALAVRIKGTYGPEQPEREIPNIVPPCGAAIDLDFDQAATAAGLVPLAFDQREARGLFPGLQLPAW